MTDAQATADDTVEKFCGDAQTYIVALDRYGDVLTSTAPTVGDVRDGGIRPDRARGRRGLGR